MVGLDGLVGELLAGWLELGLWRTMQMPQLCSILSIEEYHGCTTSPKLKDMVWHPKQPTPFSAMRPVD